MSLLTKGRYRARLAEGEGDLARAQALRHLSFRARRGLPGEAGRDADALDSRCRHVLVEEVAGGQVVCCFRLLALGSGAEIGQSYSAQFYDLAALSGFGGAMAELGRFCIHPGWGDPDILRIAWGALTRIVDEGGVGMLFGCTSFEGAAPQRHRAALALLAARHLAPPRWAPGVKAARAERFAARALAPVDPVAALRAMPPLLRTYLAMGGWVSDHAVPDHELDTLHVFTGLEIAAIPAARARALRAVAG